LTLWQELEIEPKAIMNKALAVAFPMLPLTPEQEEDSDLAGPFFFASFLGIALLLQGKVHIGYVFGYGVVGSLLIWLLMSLMSEGVSLDRVISVLGYSLTPLCALGLIGVVCSLQGFSGMLLSAGAVLWCTVIATRFFEKALRMREQRWLIAYPVFLLFACFALITVF